MTQKIPKQEFTAEFKEQAVKRVKDGKSVSAVAKEMGLVEQQPPEQRERITLVQIKADNGPESNGRRTRYLNRMVALADHIGKPVQLLYYPPYHSKYNPVERCWGILEQHWNGALLVDARTMLEWAKSMTWKGLNPVVEVSRQVYDKGISLSKAAMKGIEAR